METGVPGAAVVPVHGEQIVVAGERTVARNRPGAEGNRYDAIRRNGAFLAFLREMDVVDRIGRDGVGFDIRSRFAELGTEPRGCVVQKHAEILCLVGAFVPRSVEILPRTDDYGVERDAHIDLGGVVVLVARVDILRPGGLDVIQPVVAGEGGADGIGDQAGAGDGVDGKIVAGEVEDGTGGDFDGCELGHVEVGGECAFADKGERDTLAHGQSGEVARHADAGKRQAHPADRAGIELPGAGVAVENIVRPVEQAKRSVALAAHRHEVALERLAGIYPARIQFRLRMEVRVPFGIVLVVVLMQGKQIIGAAFVERTARRRPGAEGNGCSALRRGGAFPASLLEMDGVDRRIQDFMVYKTISFLAKFGTEPARGILRVAQEHVESSRIVVFVIPRTVEVLPVGAGRLVERNPHIHLGAVVVDVARVDILRPCRLDIVQPFVGVGPRPRIDDAARAGDARDSENIAVEVERDAFGDRHRALAAPVGVFRERGVFGYGFIRPRRQRRCYADCGRDKRKPPDAGATKRVHSDFQQLERHANAPYAVIRLLEKPTSPRFA